MKFRVRFFEPLTSEFRGLIGLLSNQGEKSVNLSFIMVPLRKTVLKYGIPKPRLYPIIRGL